MTLVTRNTTVSCYISGGMYVRNTIHRSLAGFLAVWLSGVLFLFCCPSSKAAVATADSCPLAKVRSHCDKAKKSDPAFPSAEAPAPVCTNCAFLPVIFDKSRKVDVVQKQLAAPVRDAVVPARDLTVSSPKKLLSSEYKTYIPDRHATHLMHCVFRI